METAESRREVVALPSAHGWLQRLPWLPALAITTVVTAIYHVIGTAGPTGAYLRWAIDGTDRLIHWDGIWYLRIALNGYAPTPTVQQPSAFFPLFPGTARLLQAALPFLSILNAGLVLNFALTCAAMVLVDRAFSDWPLSQRIRLVLLLLAVPGAFFFTVFYSEAFFVFALALCLWAVRTPGRLWFAAVAVALASADRVIGSVLILPLAITFFSRRGMSKAILAAAVALTGVAAGVVTILVTGGWKELTSSRNGFHGLSAPYFVSVLGHPLQTLRQWKSMALFQPIPGNTPEMNVSLPWGLGFYEDAIAIPLAWLAMRFDRTIGLFGAFLLAATLTLGGIASQMRFLLVVWPLWIGAAAWLGGSPARRALQWCLIVLGLIVNLSLMHTFALYDWAG